MSFHIASQSIQVPRLGLSINFSSDPADTSKVLCEIVSTGLMDLDEDGRPDGEPGPAHTLTMAFNRGGQMLYKRIEDPEGAGTHEEIALKPIADVSDPRPAPAAVNTVNTFTKPEPVEETAHVDGPPAQPVHEADAWDDTTDKPIFHSNPAPRPVDPFDQPGKKPSPDGYYEAGAQPTPKRP